MTKTSKISIIIVSWNSSREIVACIDSIYAQNHVPCEVIVIDNASSDNTIELIKNYEKKLRFISNNHNLGFAQATNQGLALAAGNYILLLNPDTILQPEALHIMASFMESSPTVGALGPQLLNADGTIQPSCREFPRPAGSSPAWPGFSPATRFSAPGGWAVLTTKAGGRWISRWGLA